MMPMTKDVIIAESSLKGPGCKRTNKKRAYRRFALVELDGKVGESTDSCQGSYSSGGTPAHTVDIVEGMN